MIRLYRAFVAMVRRSGRVIIVPEKTRIAFQVRMSFAVVSLRRARVIGHLVLARRQPRPFFRRIDTISRRNRVHHFVLQRKEDLNAEFARLVHSAYEVGQQRHLAVRD